MITMDHKTGQNKLTAGIGHIIHLFPEIEMYLSMAKNNSRLAKQILDTVLLCKRTFERKQIAELESFEGGPKQIVREIVESISHILNEMHMKVKIRSKIMWGDELEFPWRLYKSLLLHIFLWSINIAASSKIIYIDLSI